MTDQLRWGALGVARINDQVLPAIQQANNATLHGIASRSIDRAQQAASHFGIPNAFGSYEDLLASPEIDAVYIPLPNTLHDEWSRKAADAGKHVLCEKPLCPTADEAEALIAYGESKGVKILDGFMWPHHPRTQELKNLLEDGTIGEVRRVVGSFSFQMDPEDTKNIRLQRNLAGGSLLDIGCYPVYGIRWAMNAEPTRVFASARFVNDVDLEMSGTLEFADERSALFDCSFQMPYRCWLEIIGSKGEIYIPRMWQPKPEANYFILLDGNQEERVVSGENHVVHMIQNFSNAVLKGEKIQPDPREAVKSLRVMDALDLSAREHRVVEVTS